MTKEGATLPSRAAAGQKAFFVTLVDPQAHDPWVGMTIYLEIEDFLIQPPILQQNCHPTGAQRSGPAVNAICAADSEGRYFVGFFAAGNCIVRTMPSPSFT